MKRNLAICAFLISTAVATAQKAQVFEIKMQPQKKYTLEAVTLTTINMDVPVQGPMTILQESKSPFTMTTSKADASGNIPTELKYGDVSLKQTVNGQAMDQKNPASGMVVVGRFDSSGKFTMESAKGENVTEELKTMLNSLLETGLKQINFPKTALKVGDSFDDSTPLKIPLAQLGSLNATIKSNYTLTKIEKGIGYFDSKQNLVMDANDSTQFTASATGSGTGKVEVSIADKYLKKNAAVMDMDMTIEAQGMKMEMKSKSTTSTTATVSNL